LALPPEEPDPKSDKKKKSEVAQQDVFMREVDDALRKDEMQSFFSRYGVPLALLLVLGLGGFAGYLWWQDSLAQVAEKRGEDYVIALDHLDANRFGEADGKLSLLANEEGIASATAAKLLRAGIAMEQKRTKDAIKLYAEVAGDAAAPQPYRDMATVREVAANFDAMKPEDVIVRLKPLAVPGNPWFGVAGEMVGIAYLKQDKKDLAGPIFAKIAEDKDMPETLRERARQFAVSLGVDTLDDVIEDEAEKLAKDAEESADDADEDGGAPAT
jgi:hypothetical protein